MEQNRLPENYRSRPLERHPFADGLWLHRTLGGREDSIPPRFRDGGALLFEMETRTVLVRGPLSRAYRHHLPGTRRIGITFRPGTLRHVFGLVPEALADTMQAGGLLPVPRPPDRAWASESSLQHWLLGQMTPLSGRCAALREAPPLPGLSFPIDTAPSVSAWAKVANMTERTLHRRCLYFFGLAPKVCLRLIRLSAAMAMLCGKEAGLCGGTPLSVAAQHAGYADQAHFCHECRNILGCTPGEAKSAHRVFYLHEKASVSHAPGKNGRFFCARASSGHFNLEMS